MPAVGQPGRQKTLTASVSVVTAAESTTHFLLLKPLLKDTLSLIILQTKEASLGHSTSGDA